MNKSCIVGCQRVIPMQAQCIHTKVTSIDMNPPLSKPYGVCGNFFGGLDDCILLLTRDQGTIGMVVAVWKAFSGNAQSGV